MRTRAATFAVVFFVGLLGASIPRAAHAQSAPPPPLPVVTPTDTQEPNGPPAIGANALSPPLDGSPAPPTPTTNAPSPSPSPTPRPGGMAKPASATAGATDKLTIESADTSEFDDATQTGTLVGLVQLLYGGYKIHCDRASYNRGTHVITLENNVTLTSDAETLFADRLQFNTRTETFTSQGASTIIPPELISGALLQPLFLSGATITREGNVIVATDGLVTTCDFPNPHYKIGFARAQIIPNDRIILRKAVLYRYDRPELRIDYLSLPIRDEVRYSYLPVVGKDNILGYYVKNALGYSLEKGFPGILRVDETQNLGMGLGFDQGYRFGQKAVGSLVVYHLANEFSEQLQHQEIVGDTLFGATSAYQKNSYLALSTQSTTSNTTLNLARAIGASNTTASLTVGNTSQSGSTGQTSNYSLSQTQRYSSSGSLNVQLTGSSSNNTTQYTQTTAAVAATATTAATDATSEVVSTSTGTTQQNLNLSALGKSGIFDYNLSSNKILDNRETGSSSGSVYNGPEKLPDLTVATDSDRLKRIFLPGLFSAVPFKFSFGYGRYAETAQVENTSTDEEVEKRVLATRSLFDAAVNPRPIPVTPGGRLSLQTDGDYRQTFYTGDYAEYVLKQDDTLTETLNPTSTVNVVYGYLRGYGGAPTTFTSDQTGSTNNLSTNLTLNEARVKVVASTGYDIQEARMHEEGIRNDPWQTLSTQLALNPSHIFQTSFTTAYDFNSGRLLSANNRVRVRGKGDFAFDTSEDFDPTTKRLSQISEVLQTPVFSRDLRLSALAGYNGLTRTFSYKNFGIVRSFHDYEYSFIYQDQPYGLRTQSGFSFSIRLKAFPTTSQPATGQYGTALTAGTGPVF